MLNQQLLNLPWTVNIDISKMLQINGVNELAGPANVKKYVRPKSQPVPTKSTQL